MYHQHPNSLEAGVSTCRGNLPRAETCLNPRRNPAPPPKPRHLPRELRCAQLRGRWAAVPLSAAHLRGRRGEMLLGTPGQGEGLSKGERAGEVGVMNVLQQHGQDVFLFCFS